MEAEHLDYVNELVGRLRWLDVTISELRTVLRRTEMFETIEIDISYVPRTVAKVEVRTAGMINLLLDQRRLMVMELEGLGLTGIPTPP